MKEIKVMIILTLIALFFPMFSQTLLAEEMSGREIIDQTRALEMVDDMQAELEMEIIQNGRTRKRELMMSSYRGDKGQEMTLIRFLSPADVRNSGFLNIIHADGEEESWIYLPALGRERRIISEDRGGSFMGSDFSYEDITPTIDDYEYELLGIEHINDVEVYKVVSVPKTDEIADNLYIPGILTMEDLVNGSKTVLTYREININVGLSENEFSRRSLSRPGN